MKVRTDIDKPEKGKTVVTTTATKVGPAPKEKSGGTEMKFSRGKETKTYTSARSFTGNPAYGKDNPSKPDPEFVEKARAEKKDIAYDKAGKPYRAGYTETKKEPDQVSTKIKVVPDIRPVKLQTKVLVKHKTGQQSGKLKPMGMTYGTDSPSKGGGTKYKMKVKAR